MEPSFSNRLDFPNDTITAVRVRDPRLEIESQRPYVVLSGAQVNSFQTFNATNHNNQSVQITCNGPNASIAITRLVLKKFVFNITVRGTNGSEDSPLLVPGFFSPRFLPISQVTSSESISIQNDVISNAPVNQYLIPMMNYNNEWKERNGLLSMAPSMMDQFQNYEDGVNSFRNPLLDYEEGSPYEVPRGAYVGMRVLTNEDGGTESTIELTVTEPLFISPFQWGKYANYSSSLVGVDTMSYTCTFVNNLSRVMSLTVNQGTEGGEDGIVITDVDVTLGSAALMFNYLTPSALQPIPRILVSSYFNCMLYPTQITRALANGSSFLAELAAIQLSNVPRRIYLYCKESMSSNNSYQQTPFASDSYFPIDRSTYPLTVQWGNDTFLTAANPEQLFNIAKKNGYIYDWNQWNNFMGSVLALEFGTDIGLPGDQAGSLLMNQQLQVSCQFINGSGRDVDSATFYCVVVSEGTFVLRDSSAAHNLGVLTRSQIINARSDPHITYQTAEDIYGGSFFTKIKNALSSLNKFAKDNKLISRGLALSGDPRLKVASRVASSFGYGGRRSRMRGGNLDIDEIRSRLTGNKKEKRVKYQDEQEGYEYSE